MATLISTIIANARIDLLANGGVLAGGSDDDYWTDDELLTHFQNGAKDMWRSILDLYKGHFLTVDITHMSIAADNPLVQGVPTNLFRVDLIRPLNIGFQSGSRGLIFKYVDNVTHPRFVQAQAFGSVAARNNVIWYTVINAGAPTAAPDIMIAPTLSEALNPLYVVYGPILGTMSSGSNNPIPGESDKALQAYVAAFARCKDREDRSPDPEFISIYATEKKSILTALTPRSIQDVETVVGMWEGDDAGDGIGY
jgi:hypothetical protein